MTDQLLLLYNEINVNNKGDFVTKFLTLIALMVVFVLAGQCTATAGVFSSNNEKAEEVRSEDILLTERNSIRFNEEFTDIYTAKIQGEIIAKVSKLASDEPLYIVLDTPGGSVFAGAVLIDNLKALGHPIHTITIFSASMGYQLVQNLGTRYILPSGVLMSHRAAGGVQGQFYGEIESRLQMVKDVVDGLDQVAAERTKTSLKQYKKSVENELWAVGEKAVKSNQADSIARATCDKTLRGTESQFINTFLGRIELIFSKCPIITAPIDFKLPNGLRGSEVDADDEESLELLNQVNTFIEETYGRKRPI